MLKNSARKILTMIVFLCSNLGATEYYAHSSAKKESDEKEQKTIAIPAITIGHPLFSYYDPYPLLCSNTSCIYRPSQYYNYNKMLGLSQDIIVVHEGDTMRTGLIPPPALNTRLLGISPSGNFIVWKNDRHIYVRNAHGICKLVATNAYCYDTVCFSHDEAILVHCMQQKITTFNLKATEWENPLVSLKKQAATSFGHGTIHALQIDKDNKMLIGHIPEYSTVLLCPVDLKHQIRFISYKTHEELYKKSRILKLLPDDTIAIIARNGAMITCNTKPYNIYFKAAKRLPIPHYLRIGTINFLDNNHILTVLQDTSSDYSPDEMLLPKQMLIIKENKIIGRWNFGCTQSAGISPDGETIYAKNFGYITKVKTRDLLRLVTQQTDITMPKPITHHSIPSSKTSSILK